MEKRRFGQARHLTCFFPIRGCGCYFHPFQHDEPLPDTLLSMRNLIALVLREAQGDTGIDAAKLAL
jgi:hypothetical protein